MKLRYALAAAVAACVNFVGNTLFLLASETEKIVPAAGANGAGLAVSKWLLLLFPAAALAFTLYYLVMRLTRRDAPAEKERLEARSMLFASLAVALMGWLAALLLL